VANKRRGRGGALGGQSGRRTDELAASRTLSRRPTRWLAACLPGAVAFLFASRVSAALYFMHMLMKRKRDSVDLGVSGGGARVSLELVLRRF